MPHSLRAKLNSLRYKGILEDKDYKRLCKALDKENVLEQIRTEIETMDFDFGDYYDNTNEIIEMVCKVIDRYKEESEEQE